MSVASNGHTPVMLPEVLEALTPANGGIYVDATFGAGGYSQAILDTAKCSVWGIDRDPEAVARGLDIAVRYSNRLTVLRGCFGDMRNLLEKSGVREVDGIAFDLGVSSMQIDDGERGFSFSHDGPLDMRMGKDGMSAADVVNGMAEKELADLIYKYGEERASRKIARAVVNDRLQTPFTKTGQLADLVRSVVKRSVGGIDPATRTFQALRIYVNDELGELERGLRAAESLLALKGRLAVVSFHSLEDKRVKDFMRERSGSSPRGSRHLPQPDTAPSPPVLRLLQRSVIKPSDAEIACNPRARSARLRVVERILPNSYEART